MVNNPIKPLAKIERARRVKALKHRVETAILMADAVYENATMKVGHDAILIKPDHKQMAIYIAIAGSNDTDDWRNNLAADLARFGYHSGFFSSAHALHPQLDQELNKVLESTGYTSVILTGHSRGGNLALMVAEYLVLKAKTIPFHLQGVITLGAAKCMNNQGLDQWLAIMKHTVVVNIVNDGDLIPRLPSSLIGLLVTFRNIKRSWTWRRYQRNPNTVLVMASGLPILEPSLKQWLCCLVLDAPFGRLCDHLMERYKDRLDWSLSMYDEDWELLLDRTLPNG